MRIALYQPDIPQNTGNIFRLGACLGVSVDIIEPTGFIFDNKKFKRSAMDYIDHLNYKRHIDWKHFYDWSNENKFRIVLMTTKATLSLYKFKFQSSDILLFGRESAGVPDDIHRLIKDRLRIPMKNNMRSLNIASSVAIILAESLKQTKLIKHGIRNQKRSCK